MFMTHVLWETDGLQFKEERNCMNNQWRWRTADCQYGEFYGRGYMQLSWRYNYQDASQALFGNRGVLEFAPWRVATEEQLAWRTALWFWRTKVGGDARVKNGEFGRSTFFINGGLECPLRDSRAPNTSRARDRFALYRIVLSAFGVNEVPRETGCYN
jgi:chitinase